MSDQQITCAECGNVFVFSASEQQFYSERGLAAPPKRCKGCRQARRAAQEGGAGGGRGPSRDGRGPRDRNDRGPRSSGNPNEYRSPMPNANGFRGAPIAPRNGAGGGNGRFAPRPGFGAPAFGGDRPAAGGERGGGRGGDRGARPPSRFDRGGSAPPRFGGGGGDAPARADGNGNGFGGPRAPYAPRPAADGRPAPRAPRERQPGASWGTRPNERSAGPRSNDGGQRPPRAPRGKDGAAAPPRETKPNERAPGTRPERPRYDITCGECGTQAQVPFKPLEGRQVFCQPCYRARKGPAPGDAPAGDDTDTGIVE